MVVDGGGHFRPAGIDGVHTCLYYSRPLSHMTVPRVIQLYNITPETTENQRTQPNAGTVHDLRQESMNSVPLMVTHRY